MTELQRAIRDAIRQELKPIIKSIDRMEKQISKIDKRVDSVDERITKSFTVRLQDFVTNFNKTDLKRKP